MRFDEYQEKAARTINGELTADEILHHALFELSSEVGEISGIFQKELQGHEVNIDHLIEEIGDVLWGLAELCTVYDFDLGEVAKANIEKLKKRYPSGFETERSVNRS